MQSLLHKRILLAGGIIVAAVVALVMLYGVPAQAQIPEGGGAIEAGTASIGTPTEQEIIWTDTLEPLSSGQTAQLARGLETSGLPGPGLGDTASSFVSMSAGIPPASLSGDLNLTSGLEPQLPGDPKIFRKSKPGTVVPAGFMSNVMETSVAQRGKEAYITGNWFAARSKKGGKNGTWQYVNAFADMPDFCCDQVTIYDESRDSLFWLRMGIPDANAVNRFRLGRSKNGGKTFCNYDIAPTSLNGTWTNQFWDYAHMQIGADYLYITWNMFSAGGWTRTVILRWPLDELASCSGFSYNFFNVSDWFTFVPVQGAKHRMYWASNWAITAGPDQFRIWFWDEDSTTINWVTRTVGSWARTSRGQALCGAAEGNWAARYDDRLLTGARYSINSTTVKIPGRKILGWWWNVKQNGGFASPYIEAAAFYEDTLLQLGGNQGRPLVWNPAICFAYPSATPNKRQDLAIIFHYSVDEDQKPAVGYAIADDYVSAPPGFVFFNVISSKARPSDEKWGDYNTLREYEPSEKTWVGGSHYIAQNTNCATCSTPVFFNFGRVRDKASWKQWVNK